MAAVVDELRRLEGRAVGVALADGTSIDGAVVVSAGRPGVTTAWLFVAGADRFVPLAAVIDVWEPSTRRRRAWEHGA